MRPLSHIQAVALAGLVGLVAVVSAAVGCSSTSAPSGPDATWVGTITTEGDITTVVNESGSVWGGTARLVEEASIGVEAGSEEYILGQVVSVYATDDRIYLLDAQVPAVRVYGHDGSYIRTLGRQGQGPGEYQSPYMLAADASGRAFVFDSIAYRVNVYSESGEPAGAWPVPKARCCGWRMWYLGNDTLWIPVRESMQTIQTRVGARLHGPDGPRGEVLWQPEIEYESATFEIEGYDTEYMAPFTPRLLWELTADGGIVAGASDSYRFEIHRPGSPTLVVERYWEPVPVPPGHRDWERRDTVSFRRRYGARGWNWDGAEIPTHKPAFRGLIPTRSGATWVLREGPSQQLTDCVEDPIEAGYAAARANPCWRNLYILDAFAADGRYLGRVETPPNLWPAASPFVDGELVVAVTQDESGVFRVKRYRLVPPDED